MTKIKFKRYSESKRSRQYAPLRRRETAMTTYTYLRTGWRST